MLAKLLVVLQKDSRMNLPMIIVRTIPKKKGEAC